MKDPLTVEDLAWLLRREFDGYIILDRIEIDHERQEITITYRDGKKSKPETKAFPVGS